MLAHLSIRDFVIVDQLELEFRRGFTALTGETGAGKSILIDALALALGERADALQIRSGAERADVSAEFDITAVAGLRQWLQEQALEGDVGTLLLRRVVDRNGRSRAFINGHAATLAQLREAGEALVDIHGQHAHQSLLRADAQRQLLDGHAGLAATAAEVSAAYREWQNLTKARLEYETHAAIRNAEREQLSWQVDDLKALAPVAGEWEQLQSEHTRLSHAASLIDGARSAMEALTESDGATVASLSAVISKLSALSGYDAKLDPIIELLSSAEVQLQEAAHGLRNYADRVDLDPSRLSEVEQRVESLHGASRKFRQRPENLPDFAEKLAARLSELEVSSDIELLSRREQAAHSAYLAVASNLTAGRRKAATKLSKEVTAAMKELAMAGARFEVSLRPVPEGSSGGDEQVEFLVAANAGSELRPLAKVASGGELSRISLSIQVITSKAAAVPTLIFDEVDAGIGGGVAEVVGRKLRALGDERQVLCVTHLPQVAAQAGEQWSVRKGSDKMPGRQKKGDAALATHSRVEVLDRDGRIEEVARMLGGVEITATTRRHASEMLGFK